MLDPFLLEYPYLPPQLHSTLRHHHFMMIIVVIGFSVDFVAHVGIAYATSSEATRYGKTAQAVRELGISCVSGGTSTALVSDSADYAEERVRTAPRRDLAL